MDQHHKTFSLNAALPGAVVVVVAAMAGGIASPTAAAQDRPSAMAHTIRDCPRQASPATNTPGVLVM